MEPLFLPCYGPCEYIFVLFTFYSFFFCGIFFAAEASVKRERPFGTPVLRRSIEIRVKRKNLIHRCLLWWTRQVSTLKPTDPCRLFDRQSPSLHILSSNGSIFFMGNLLAIGPIGRENSFPIFGMRCAWRGCISNSRRRSGPSIHVFAASFWIGKQPKRDCIAFLAYKYGSAGSVS